ncbi:helix-hairpin-helix domain-containing protein [Halomonas sp. NPDC076908]|uniref:helix-hairpin-helix domain-containing protein n=1 Tax=Halomonas sp. NPDC076908 TaxID=3390567 RepID=UPI003D00665A
MTNDEHTTPLAIEQLRDGISALMQTVTSLLDDEATLATLETALHSHDALSDQLASYTLDSSAADALQRIEHFITLQAGQYYQAYEATLQGQENNRFIPLFARQLLALEGIGPATARQLFQSGIFTPEALYALTPQALEALELPPSMLARLLSLRY